MRGTYFTRRLFATLLAGKKVISYRGARFGTTCHDPGPIKLMLYRKQLELFDLGKVDQYNPVTGASKIVL